MILAFVADRRQKPGVSWRSLSRVSQRSKGKFHVEELVLFETFIYRREVLGLAVGGEDVRRMFKTICSVSRPEGWDTCRFSNGWIWRWKRRFGVVKR